MKTNTVRLLAWGVAAVVCCGGVSNAQVAPPATQPAPVGSVAADPVTQAVRAEHLTAEPATNPREVEVLRSEVASLRRELEEVRANRPATLPRQWPYRPTETPAAPVVTPAAPAPTDATAVPMERAVAYPGGFVGVSDVTVSSLHEVGHRYLKVAADVTLNGVANVPFVYEARLVTPDGRVHTDSRGKPYVATREIKTGDLEDTDDYAVLIDMDSLFSSRPPEDLFVQVRVLDLQGAVAASSGLYSFKRPWK